MNKSPFPTELQKALEAEAVKFISAHRFQPDEDRTAYARDVEWLLTRGAGLAVRERDKYYEGRTPATLHDAHSRPIRVFITGW